MGIGSTSFFESDDDVAKGGDGVFSTDDCYELLADAVEREAFPLTLHFRRRREADADVFVDAAPCDDALPAAAEEDDYFGFGGDDDAGDDDAAETVVVPHLRRVDERSCVVVGRPAAARLRAVDSGAPCADWVVFDAAEGQMLDGESLPWPAQATVVDVRLRDAEDAWSGPFALRRAGTASVLRIEDCWFVDEDEDPLRRIQRGGALCLRLKAQGEGHVRVVGEYKDLTLRADAHVASDDPHISLRPRPDDRRRWYAAVLDDGGDDAPLAFSVQVEVDGGASSNIAARVARKEDVLRPQPEHELVAGALPAVLARVAACSYNRGRLRRIGRARRRIGRRGARRHHKWVARNWTRRPLGAAAAASLLKAAGARDEACAYASSVRDAPPSTPCALFRGSSEEAPALEPLVGAATREEHNREPFFDVLATLRKEQAPHLAAALLRGAGARLAPSSNDEVPWFAASTKVEDHDRALWCFEGSERTLYVPTIIEKGITKLDPRGYAFFAPGIERRAAQPWSRLEGHVGVVGKASLVAYDALPPAWEALLRHGVRRIHGPYARVFGGASGEATDATERVAICSSCDATQRAPVRRCVAGGAFVLRGPPGTGKSATLANSCLALAATGRSVLVVGQEVAAARVVAAKVGEILGGSRGVAGPDALMSRRKLQVDSLQVRIQRAADEAALPPATFAAEWLDRGFRVSPVNDVDDAYATCLFRPRPKAAPDRRFVCELCGRDTASAAPMAKHLRTHAEPKRRRKGDDAISERRRVVDAWRADEARIDVAHVARAAAVARQAQAADALHDADRALREALKRLEPADAAGERLAALALRCALDDVEVDGGEAFAHECAAPDAAARALLAVLDAVADRRLGAAAASSALERCATAAGRARRPGACWRRAAAEGRRRAARGLAARRADASSVPDAPDVRALSDARRAASLALARAAVDAHFSGIQRTVDHVRDARARRVPESRRRRALRRGPHRRGVAVPDDAARAGPLRGGVVDDRGRGRRPPAAAAAPRDGPARRRRRRRARRPRAAGVALPQRLPDAHRRVERAVLWESVGRAGVCAEGTGLSCHRGRRADGVGAGPARRAGERGPGPAHRRRRRRAREGGGRGGRAAVRRRRDIEPAPARFDIQAAARERRGPRGPPDVQGEPAARAYQWKGRESRPAALRRVHRPHPGRGAGHDLPLRRPRAARGRGDGGSRDAGPPRGGGGLGRRASISKDAAAAACAERAPLQYAVARARPPAPERGHHAGRRDHALLHP